MGGKQETNNRDEIEDEDEGNLMGMEKEKAQSSEKGEGMEKDLD